MIQASNLCKAYGTQVLFDDAGFVVGSGERIGLVGRNGHGKTTLLRILTGEEKPDSGVISIPKHYTVGFLSQHLEFRGNSVLEEGCLGLRPSEDGTDESYKAEAILMGLGFANEDFLLDPHDLSGGYQVRLHLAKLLVSEPNILLLDEPTNYLDIVSIRWLTRFLKGWKGELILITHDREFMDGVTTHTMGIHRHRIRKIAGPTLKLYQQILTEEEVHEKTRLNEEKKRREIEQFINRFRAQATRARAVQSKIKGLNRQGRLEKLSDQKNLDFEFVPAPFTGKALIEAKDISFAFGPQTNPLIRNFSITIGKRDRIAVIGKNGKGKTTLLNLLASELQPLSGTVTHHPQLRLAYFGQTNIQRLSPEKTVEQEMLDAHPDHSRSAARAICGIMMFERDSALKKVSVLSGGEKSRVLLGKLIVSPANLLLLDEPTNHLDMESIDSLIEAIDAFQGAVLIVTHSEMILHALATKLVIFYDSTLKTFDGTYHDFIRQGGWNGEESTPENNRQLPAKKGNGVNRLGMKKVRTELINSRSRTLGPLQTKIAAVEQEIMHCEKTHEQDTHALVEASVKGDIQLIRQLSVSTHESKLKIEALFTELESLTSELNQKTREFEEKFAELEA